MHLKQMENENLNKDLMDTNPRKLRAYCFIWLIVCILVLIVCVILSRAEEKDGNDDDHVPRIYSVLVEGEPLAFHAATNINRLRSICESIRFNSSISTYFPIFHVL